MKPERLSDDEIINLTKRIDGGGGGEVTQAEYLNLFHTIQLIQREADVQLLKNLAAHAADLGSFERAYRVLEMMPLGVVRENPFIVPK